MELNKAIEKRRSYYNLEKRSSVSDKELQNLIETAVLHVPSAFNSQSARVVLLLNENHNKLWDIVLDEIKKQVDENAFEKTSIKVNNCFKAGYGTVLFFEDQSIIKDLQEQFPLYKDNFPVWSDQGNGMVQYAVWTLLEDAGLGASLQHYNPIIDKAITIQWNINPDWKLMAQMPFGIPVGEPNPKEFKPLAERFFVFK